MVDPEDLMAGQRLQRGSINSGHRQSKAAFGPLWLRVHRHQQS